jgi:hypothetical protein
MSVKMRQEVERKIVGQFVKDALAAGFCWPFPWSAAMTVDEMLIGSTNFDKIMEEAFAGDESHIFIQPKEGPTTTAEGQCIFGGLGVLRDGQRRLGRYQRLLRQRTH